MADKALVLGGGGITGVAWEIGMLAGLACEHGLDLSDADLVVGTSAGSVVGVDVRSGISLATFYEGQTAALSSNEVAASMGGALTLRYVLAVAFTQSPVRARKRIGRIALKARTEPEEVRREVFESRMPVGEWPEGKLKLTAVDTATGEFTVFDAGSGVALVDAVAASCAVPGIWPPVTIDGKRYMDGGMRSAANADLALGYKQVVVIAPLTQGFGPIPGTSAQVKQLTAQGARAVLIKPDPEALRAIGRNVLDPANRAAAARAGYAQAANEAAAVKQVWV
ncbi:MAG TPA: patatin-like phospholipase family protein [Streptosporangiaceae bacterium]|nr:patatin-like phospholipase family protein [Streptosporangiaceae bacterium]